MLSLQLKSGEYLTIGDEIAVQVFQQHGSSFRVEVKAPREIPILRGSVRERDGGERPDGLCRRKPSQPSRRIRNARNMQAHQMRKEQQSAALQKMRDLLDHMSAESTDASRDDLDALRSCLDAFKEL